MGSEMCIRDRVNSEEDETSLIEIIQVDASVSLLFFDLSGTILET